VSDGAGSPANNPSITSLDRAKVEARAKARVARAAACAAAPDADVRVRDRFLAELLPIVGVTSGAFVSAYMPMRGELDPRPLLQALVERGMVAAMPCVVGNGMPLLFRQWNTGAALVPRAFGLSEPGDDAPVVEPDFLLVPLLAFDRRGHRLGYGRGYYDRTLAALRAQRSIVAVGLAFAAQEVLSLPVGINDQRLDWIVTETALIHPAI
jgi:5-formyltetrahydrofolate cyclo-ligase